MPSWAQQGSDGESRQTSSLLLDFGLLALVGVVRRRVTRSIAEVIWSVDRRVNDARSNLDLCLCNRLRLPHCHDSLVELLPVDSHLLAAVALAIPWTK